MRCPFPATIAEILPVAAAIFGIFNHLILTLLLTDQTAVFPGPGTFKMIV
jgi:hypothetical protein